MQLELPMFIYTHEIKGANKGKPCSQFYEEIGFSNADAEALCYQEEWKYPLDDY